MNVIFEDIYDIIYSTEEYKKYHYIAKDLINFPCEENDNIHKNQLYNFIHNGLRCSVRRRLCVWCGYVEYYNFRRITEESDINVYGGITYSSENSNGIKKIGFDTFHGDIDPTDFLIRFPTIIDIPEYKTYKTYDFVVNETKKLAEQISVLIN